MTFAPFSRVLANSTQVIRSAAGFSDFRKYAAHVVLLSVAATLGWGVEAPSFLPHIPLALDTLAEFRPVTGNWRIVGGIAEVSRESKTLSGTPGTGVLINVPRPDAKAPLVTAWEHGDLSL